MFYLGVFRNDILLNSSTSMNRDNWQLFADSVSQSFGFDIEDLDFIAFESTDLKQYFKENIFRPDYKVMVTKESIKVEKLTKIEKTFEVEVDWLTCSAAQLEEHYSESDISKIEENLNYFNSLGIEKYNKDFVFEWPFEVEKETILISGSSKEFTEILTVAGEELIYIPVEEPIEE